MHCGWRRPIPVTCAAVLRGARVYLRHMTNESKFTPVELTYSVRARVKSLFETQVTGRRRYSATLGRACAASLCERRLPTCCAEAAAAAPPRAAARAVVARFEFREGRITTPLTRLLTSSGFVILTPKIELKPVQIPRVAQKKYAWDLRTNSTLMQGPQSSTFLF